MRCSIDNLSLGGTLLRPDDGWIDSLRPGTIVTVDLAITGADRFTSAGRIIRCAGRRHPVAVAFEGISDELADAVAGEVDDAVDAEAVPRIVVVAPSGAQRSQVVAMIEQTGYRPLEASTPLEAIDLIERSHNRVAAAAIAEALTQTGGDELVQFLAEAHPEVQLAVITEGATPAAATPDEVTVVRGEDVAADVPRVLDKLPPPQPEKAPPAAQAARPTRSPRPTRERADAEAPRPARKRPDATARPPRRRGSRKPPS